MLLRPYNELHFDVRIKSTSPLLIKESRFTDENRKDWSGDKEEIKKRMPNVIPISRASTIDIQRAVLNTNAYEAVSKLPFFLPASSLRGVCRSHLERALRSFDDPNSPRNCDPFESNENSPQLSCSDALNARKLQWDKLSKEKKREIPNHPYTFSCPACRLFGTTQQSSRISFTDGERIEGTGGLAQREHVRIDRRKGSVGGPPLKFFGLNDASFKFEIKLQNFELPQVILLGVLLADLTAGNITIGSGKSKGYGRVKLEMCSITLTNYAQEEPTYNELRGVAECPERGVWFQQRYGIQAAQHVEPLVPAQWTQNSAWRWSRAIQMSEFSQLWPKLKLQPARPLQDRLKLASA